MTDVSFKIQAAKEPRRGAAARTGEVSARGNKARAAGEESTAAGGARLQGLPPLAGETTALLILGSFPGAASLEARRYYAHPHNHFWPILQAIWPDGPCGTDSDSYQSRSNWLLAKGLGLWDVYAACERKGSLDAAIRQREANDFVGLARRCPCLRGIAHNGGESYKHARHTERLGLPVYRLPSSSPANASWSFERKLAAWREVFTRCGLVA